MFGILEIRKDKISDFKSKMASLSNVGDNVSFQGCKIIRMPNKIYNNLQTSQSSTQKIFAIEKGDKRIRTPSPKGMNGNTIQMNYEIKPNTINMWEDIDNMSHPKSRIDLHFYQQ